MLQRYLQHLFPDALEVVEDVGKIDLEKWYEQGVRFILSDLDNTLTDRKGTELTPEATRFLAEAKRLGIQVVIVSNTFSGRRRMLRVESIAMCHDVLCICARFPFMKPHPKPYEDALKLCGHPPAHMVRMVGDQYRTDGGGAQKHGIALVKVKPIGPDGWYTRPSRCLENWVIRNRKR